MDLLGRSIVFYADASTRTLMQETQEFAGAAITLGAEKTEWLLLAVPGLIWGASLLFIAEGMHAVGPWGLTFVRILIGFVTLSLFPPARRPIMHRDWASIVWLGVLWLAFPLTMFPFAELLALGVLGTAVAHVIMSVAAGQPRCYTCVCHDLSCPCGGPCTGDTGAS
jgi:hypothetical protein